MTIPHIDELGTPAAYNHYTTGWAWAFDTPFPYWKRWAGYEGGVADMCFMSWPARIDAQHGACGSSTRTLLTWSRPSTNCLSIELPETIKGYPQSAIEGESFAASLTDPKAPGKQSQFYAMLGQRSIYDEAGSPAHSIRR